MSRIVALLLIAASLLAPVAARAEPADIAAAGRGVVRVVLVSEAGGELMMIGHGSGFAVSGTQVMTNAHVVKAARDLDIVRIGVVPPEGKTGWFARIVAFAPDIDLALLELTEKGSMQPLTVFTGEVRDGNDVFAVGYPGNVDQAQGLGFGDIISPTSPVKTRGNVSTGRSAREFETILHTAAIGSGNSGGPLLDECGRVIGVNSFGTIAGAADSEFYFAVSSKEIMRFLHKAGVRPRSTGNVCRSLADLERSEAQRDTSERVESEELARRAAEAEREAQDRAGRQALLEIMGERDNSLAMAGLAMMLALAAGGAGLMLMERHRRRDAKIAGGTSIVLIVVSVIVWLSRPGLAELEDREAQIAAGQSKGGANQPGDRPGSGQFVCLIDADRSRLTVSEPDDLTFGWDEKQGCANGSSRFTRGPAGWSRISIPGGENTVSVSTFDPEDGSYRIENYFLGLSDMATVRAELAKQKSSGCSGGEDAAEMLGRVQEAARSALPAAPNERMVYSCTARE